MSQLSQPRASLYVITNTHQAACYCSWGTLQSIPAAHLHYRSIADPQPSTMLPARQSSPCIIHLQRALLLYAADYFRSKVLSHYPMTVDLSAYNPNSTIQWLRRGISALSPLISSPRPVTHLPSLLASLSYRFFLSSVHPVRCTLSHQTHCSSS